MKIPPYVASAVGSSSAVDPKSGATEKAATGSGANSSDRVQLSQNYQSLANVQKSLSGSDAIRTDKVQQIQSQLASGTYQVDSGAIAEKMMGEVM
ncbi:MAG: flagellar biosynthesis anti-sigma factor FlgM [Syntrophobacteraceae bacterium]|nr:flagellar biosynthesis anti-sigma factor FlgM [Syntrophobacteraceae bacterium]